MARRWGEAPRPAGRPALDSRGKALIFGLHADDPSLGVRRIAARVTVETGVSVSRETVRKLLRSAREADRPVVGVPVVAAEELERPTAVRPMTEADHARFDTYRGAVYESPGVWWTFP